MKERQIMIIDASVGKKHKGHMQHSSVLQEVAKEHSFIHSFIHFTFHWSYTDVELVTYTFSIINVGSVHSA